MESRQFHEKHLLLHFAEVRSGRGRQGEPEEDIVGINIALISHDAAVVSTCRSTLADLFGPDFSLAVGFNSGSAREADLCIWDFTPGEAENGFQPLDPARAQRCLFLAHRKDLGALRDAVGCSNLNVLLKPLTATTMRALLGETCGHWKEKDGGFAARKLRVERDEMLQCFMRANLRLQEYDQDRTNFLARSLHDFRAPLTASSGYCALLIGGEFGPLAQEQQEVLQRMQFSLRRLSRMTDAMFQLSISNRIEPKLVFQPGDLRDCVERAVLEVTPFIDEKRISVTVDVEPWETLCFDRAQVEQMLMNLLDNACKFTPRAGSIKVRGYPFFWERRSGQAARLDPSADRRVKEVDEPNSFRIDIQDSGPGIPTAHLDSIFEEFASYSGGGDRSGGGLGLAICRMIAHQHQGRIWAENSPDGAVFSFVLPSQRTGAAFRRDGIGAEAAQ